MLIKDKDPLASAIQQLENIIQLPNLPRYKLEQAQQELRMLKAGMYGEKDAAYFINFDFAERRGIAVIHDLRLEHQGYVAQIDHLLISRFLEFYVLESKTFAQGIKITERGEFLVEYHGSYKAIESPIEQNRRHGQLLWKLLLERPILPTRLGITLQPKVISYILVSPKSMVKRPAKNTFDTDMVIKADELLRRIQLADEKESALSVVSSLANMVSTETLEQIARNLVALHKPAPINYYARFGIDPNLLAQSSPEQSTVSVNYCFRCRKTISRAEADFCFQRKQRFGGRAYCRNCQKLFP